MTITPKVKLRITVAACAIVIPLFLSACRRDHNASSNPPVNTNDMGWFSAIHAAQPNSRVDAGWWLLVSRGQDGSLIWSVNNRKTDEARLRALLAKMRDIGFDGVLLDADDDVPVSFIKKTLDILHEYNQRHVVLFRRIEGVESEFFQKISEGMLTNVIEAGESSPATKAVNFGSSHVKAAHQRTPSFEIKQMPKRKFLETISKAVDLTDDEKKAVISGISDGAYTHCRFAKYLKDGKTSLEVEKCNPQKEIGKDADGHTMVEGGSGSVSVYEKVDGHWVPVVSTQYD